MRFVAGALSTAGRLARHGVDGSSGDFVVGQRPNRAGRGVEERTSRSGGV